MRLANSRNPLPRRRAPSRRRRAAAAVLTIALGLGWALGANLPLRAAAGRTGLDRLPASDPFAAVDVPALTSGGAANDPSARSAPAVASPAVASPAAVPVGPPVARDLSVHNGAVTLAGTLLLPAGTGPFPAVVLLPGRGAAGRDQAAADARLFASHGVAAFAYDKRGTGASTGDWRSTLDLNDEVGDAVAAVAAVRRQADVDPSRVGVWGVGQGAWLAPFVGEHADVAFLILLNTSAAPLGQEEIWRTGDVVRARGFSSAAADAAMRGVRLLVGARPVLAALLPHSQLGFLKDDPYNTPADALKRARAPTLLVYDDLDPNAPGVKPTVALLQAAQHRDQPLDHVGVLGRQNQGHDGAGVGGDSASALANARRAADPTYRSLVVGWTTTVVRSLAPAAPGGALLASAGGTAVGTAVGTAPSPLALVAATTATTAGTTAPTAPAAPLPAAAGASPLSSTARGPAADRSLLLPTSSDRPPPWYASPWVQLGAAVFFLIAFGEGLLLSVLPRRRRPDAIGGRREPDTRRGASALRTAATRPEASDAPASRAASLLRVTQALVSLVDLALLAGMAVAIGFLLGLYHPHGLSLPPLAAGLRALSALSGVLAVALAVLTLLVRRSTRAPRTVVAVVVAIAAALFLPFLVYWQVPFLAG